VHLLLLLLLLPMLLLLLFHWPGAVLQGVPSAGHRPNLGRAQEIDCAPAAAAGAAAV
jgi:hypothetical protein